MTDPHTLSPSSICCTHSTGHRCPGGEKSDFKVELTSNSDLIHCALQLILLELPDLLRIVCCLFLVLSAGIHCIIIDLQNIANYMFLFQRFWIPLRISSLSFSELAHPHSQRDRRSSSGRGWTAAFFLQESTSSTILASWSTTVVRPAPFSAALTVERGSLSASFHSPEHMCYKRNVLSESPCSHSSSFWQRGSGCCGSSLPTQPRCDIPSLADREDVDQRGGSGDCATPGATSSCTPCGCTGCAPTGSPPVSSSRRAGSG